MAQAISSFRADAASVAIYKTKRELAQAAALAAGELLAAALARRGEARIIVGTGPS